MRGGQRNVPRGIPGGLGDNLKRATQGDERRVSSLRGDVNRPWGGGSVVKNRRSQMAGCLRPITAVREISPLIRGKGIVIHKKRKCKGEGERQGTDIT